jgi:hypothetical protein
LPLTLGRLLALRTKVDKPEKTWRDKHSSLIVQKHQ